MKLQLVIVCLAISAAAVAASVKVFGAWNPITNLKDPKVVEIAEFAVSEYNKQGKTTKLDSIEKGEFQVGEGTNYRLVLVVQEGAAVNKYDAVVLVTQPGNFKQMTLFNPHH